MVESAEDQSANPSEDPARNRDSGYAQIFLVRRVKRHAKADSDSQTSQNSLFWTVPPNTTFLYALDSSSGNRPRTAACSVYDFYIDSFFLNSDNGSQYLAGIR